MNMTRHHILAQSLGGTWHKDNLVRLTEHTHKAVHGLFANDPPYHILRGITERYRATMDSQAYEMINGVLVQIEYTPEAYNPKCYNGTKLKDFLYATRNPE